jgi:transcriptional regulator with XRE-family HTH domain
VPIGYRIRYIRTQKGITQGDISRSTGMRRGYISRVEHGHTVPSVETLHRFAAALDIPMYRLFCTIQDRPAPLAAACKLPVTLEELAQASGAEGSDARFLLQLKLLMGKIDESDRAFLLDCARNLAARQVAKLSAGATVELRKILPQIQARLKAVDLSESFVNRKDKALQA